MSNPKNFAEKKPSSQEIPDFAEKVRSEYEKIVPKGTQFTWTKRAEDLVKNGTENLWKEYQTATTAEKVVTGGLTAVGAYIALKLLKGAINAVFDLGKWMMEKVGEIQKDSLEIILKLSIGAAAIALVPILYKAISSGKLSLSEITKVWETNKEKGLIKLLAKKFPEGMKSMPLDVKKFITDKIGVDKFNDLFENKPSKTDEIKLKKGVKPEDIQVKDGILGIFPSEETKGYIRKALSENGPWGPVWRSFLGNEGVILVNNGAAFIVNEAGELVDISKWATFQYTESWKDAIDIADKYPNQWAEGLIGGYLIEVPKFVIAANTIDAITHLFKKTPYSVIRSTLSGVGWGVTVPLRVYGLGKTILGAVPAFIKFVPGGAVLLSKSGKNIAKITTTGSILAWKGGKFVAEKVLQQTAKLGVGKTLGPAIQKIYTKTIGRQVSSFIGKDFMKKLAITAGWKGAVAAFLAADDATVIGVLDDILLVGMMACLTVDVYELIQITRDTLNFKSLMSEQEKAKIVNVEGVDKSTKERLLKISKTKNFNEEKSMLFLSSLSRAQFRITRENGKSEEYLMVRGKIIQASIIDNGVVLAKFSEEDLERLSKELPPPQKFEKWDIDYKADNEKLKAHYRLAFVYVENETGWSNLNYEIKNEKTIEIKRRTGAASIEIHRSGNQWYIGDDTQTLFDLFQAISLANLINRVEDIVLGGMVLPSGDTPFYASDKGVYVARLLNDTVVLSGKENSWYKKFYQKQLGINPTDISDSLNKRYQTHIRPLLNQKTDNYTIDFIN